VILQDRESFLRQLEDTENWLYEDGECEVKQVYTDRLAALKVCCSASSLLPLISEHAVLHMSNICLVSSLQCSRKGPVCRKGPSPFLTEGDTSMTKSELCSV